jgi:hypothetical protein
MRITAANGIALGLLVMGWAGSAPAYNPEERDNPFGVVDHLHPAAADSVHAAWMRFPEAAFRLETSEGVFNQNLSGSLDELEPRGINLAPVVNIGRCWMSGFTGAPADYPSMPPADLSATWSPETGYSPTYYAFIHWLVSNHLGRLDHLTIENEANATNFWGGTAEQYIRVLKTAYKAAHDADPDITIFDSGMGSGVWGAMILRDRYETGSYTEGQLLDFANAYYDRDAYVLASLGRTYPQNAFASFGELHDWLYSSFVNDQYQRATYMLAHMGGSVDALNFKFTGDWWLYQDVVDYIRMKMGQAGWSVPLLCNNEASNWTGVSDDQLARELVQKYVTGLSLGVGRTLWFPLSNQSDPSPRVGLYDANGARLRSWASFQHLAAVIGHEFAFDHLDLARPDVRSYVFRSRIDPAHSLVVAWWDDGSHGAGSVPARFALPPGTVRVVRSDYLGNRAEARAAGEDYMDLTVSEAPVTIEFFQDLSALAASGYPAGAPARRLGLNVPNPFNPATSIHYVVPGGLGEQGPIHLAIYDLAGTLVATLVDGIQSAGSHTIEWHGRTDRGADVAPGVYLYRLHASGVVETRKMILAR